MFATQYPIGPKKAVGETDGHLAWFSPPGPNIATVVSSCILMIWGHWFREGLVNFLP